MACNTPIVAWHRGYYDDGKPCISYSPISDGRPILMDCGSCIGCRLKKSKEWAVRCMKELEDYADACFVTLTYNDNCLPYAFNPTLYERIEIDGYEVNTDYPLVEPTLYRKDVIAFNKRLRTKLSRMGFDGKIKVFYAGEYGDESHRPHYHLLIFGFKPSDLVEYKKNKFGQQLYTSDFLSSLWYRKSPNFDKSIRRKWKHVPCGFVVVGDVTFTSISYVTRYLLKKQSTIENNLHSYCKEFLGVSNGIGLNWLENNYKTVFANGHINYVQNNEVKHCTIPRYYINKLEEIDSDLFHKVKQEAYDYLDSKVDTFDDDLKKLSNKLSNEKALHKKTYEKFKRSFENEESL